MARRSSFTATGPTVAACATWRSTARSELAGPRGEEASRAYLAVEPMDLIVGHDNTDFDALAAAVAAQRLHPGAIIGFGRVLTGPVRDFWSLHKDRFPAERVDALPLDEVVRLVVVDVRDRRRLAHVERVLERRDEGARVEVFVYDHHPACEHDVAGDAEIVEPVGAVTTLLVERLRAQEISIDPTEATLFALGIYTDTNALTLGSTTARDARAAAWLLERGAQLSVVNRYLRPRFSDAQRVALSEVLAHTELHEIGGLHVGVAALALETRVEGLADVTSEARRLLGHAALFAVTTTPRGKVEIVGRASQGGVDVGGTLRTLGGGGHPGAGSARLKTGEIGDVVARLLAALRERPPRPERVSDVMSSPVETVGPELTLAELAETLERRGVSGMPVVRDGALLGVVSRRDVARAREGGRLELPVTSHMSGNLRTVGPDAPLEEALAAMTEADVGRLPVLRDERLVGIVSRTDVLRALYPE